jgi:hypothetical protein
MFLVSETLPVHRRLVISLRHEVEQYFGRRVVLPLDRLDLSELLACSAPVSGLVVLETLVEHVQEDLYTHIQS